MHEKPEPVEYRPPAGARSYAEVYHDPDADTNDGYETEAVGGFADRPPLGDHRPFILKARKPEVKK